MRRLAAPVGTVLALVGALGPLLLFDGPTRAWAFRGYALFVGVLAATAVVRRIDAAGERTSDEPAVRPFRRPRPSVEAAHAIWSAITRRRRAKPYEGGAVLVNSATQTAGAAHHRLRPVLCAIADERLRAHDGMTLDDPRAAGRFAPETWELVRPSRRVPDDRLGPGLTLEGVAAILDDLEAR